jgi:peptidoglycan/xylan/chitin deacetylase (PgdA/CDA1 family)
MPEDLSRISLGRVPMVLMYHCIADSPDDPYGVCVTPARFAEQMAWLADQGLHGVSMSELVDAMRAGCGRGLVGLTFDDGYVGLLENALPVLQRHDFTATMYIISGLLGGTNQWDEGPVRPLVSADDVLQLAAAGMEIGSHTASHVRLSGAAAERLKTEVSDSRSQLSELIGHPVRSFAYPWGAMDATARQAVRDAGFDHACAVETPMADLGLMALPRIMFRQPDDGRRMRAKKLFFTGYTAYRGTYRQLSHYPHLRAAKRRLYALAGR